MIGKTVLRVVVGGLFVGHGAQKLFGTFGGHGLDGTAQAFEQMGLRPGLPMAAAAGASEVAGGALVALGAATPFGTAMLTGVMASAIDRVHLKNGPWVSDGGYEYPLVLIAALWYLADEGPGPISIDRLRKKVHRGPFWAIFELALGVGGAMAVRAIAERQKAGSPFAATTFSPAPGGEVADRHSDASDGVAPAAEQVATRPLGQEEKTSITAASRAS